MTGWYRDGKCRTDAWDRGSHTVCAEMTQDFLDYTKSMGNDHSRGHTDVLMVTTTVGMLNGVHGHTTN